MKKIKNNPQEKNISVNAKSKLDKLIAGITLSTMGYIIVAFVCALTLWFYVADYDTVVEKTFYSVPVQVLAPTKSDIVVESGEGKLVNVTVYGKKADINKVDNNDINAFVDVRNAPSDGEINAEINVELPDGITLVETNALSITHVVVGLAIPTVKELPVNVVMVSGNLDIMYEAVPECITCSTVNVTGSSSVIERVDRAVVNVDVGELEQPKLILGKKIELYDKDGKPVSMSYIKVTDPNGDEIVNAKVDVYIHLYMEKELPVVVKFTGGVFSTENANISVSPQTVRVKGSIDRIKRMEEITLSVDETTFEKEYNAVMELPDYGDNVKYLDSITEATVDIQLKDIQSYTHRVSASDIKSVNLPEGFAATYSFTAEDGAEAPEEVAITIRGYKKSIEQIHGKIDVVVDFSDVFEAGESPVDGAKYYALGATVMFKDINGVFTTDKISVDVVITAVPEDSSRG